MVQDSPPNISELSKSMMILLKNKSQSLSDLDLSSSHEKLFKRMILDATFSEEENQVNLKLCEFDSLTHHKFYNAIQRVFKIKGSREIKTKFSLTINGIKFPYSRNKQEFPPVVILAESKSKNVLEISVTGLSAMIFISFFLKPILNSFLKSLENVPSVFKEDENRSDDSVRVQITKVAPPVDGNEVSVEDVTDKDSDGSPKPQISDEKSFPWLKTANVIDDQHSHDNSYSEEVTKPQNDDEQIETNITEEHCYYCALLDIAVNAENLLRAENIEVRLKCVSKCDCAGNCLELFVQSVSMLVVSRDIDHNCFEYLLENIVRVVEHVIDNTEHSRAELYCRILDNLEGVAECKQPRLITLSRELCDFLIGNDAQTFADTLKKHREARRNMMNFMNQTGHYFSLQALVESWDIMHDKGIDILSLFPPLMSSVTQKFVSRPNIGSSDYFYYAADITRELIRNVLHEKNIEIVKAVKIEFKHGTDLLEKEGDLHIYFNKVDKVIYHIHRQGANIIVEKIGYDQVKYKKGENMIDSEHWIFHLSFQLKPEIDILLNSSKTLYFESEAITSRKTDNDENKKNIENQISKKVNAEPLVVDGRDFDSNENDDIDNIPDKPNMKHDDSVDSKYWNSCADGNSNHSDDISPDKHKSKKENEEPVVGLGKDLDSKENDDIDNIPDKPNTKHDDSVDGKYWNSCADDNSNHSDDSDNRRQPHHKIETSLVILKENILKYWDGKSRIFIKHLIGEEWPLGYGSTCAVRFPYVKVKKYKSAKRLNHFCRIVGHCKICNAEHTCMIQNSPFEENVLENGQIQYKVKDDLCIKVTVTGQFELNDDDAPDISKPKHNLMRAAGLHLKGNERITVGEKASKEGAQNVYMEQYDHMNEEQMKAGNKTTVRSYNVVMMARQEYEKKQRCGNDFFESVQNVYDSQKSDISLNFDETSANRELPGFVRSVQQTPFKIFMANFDQLRIGSNYMNKNKLATIYIDSSGKFLKKEKGKSKLLNTAVVIPPPAVGHTPFPIFEMVSEKNKTVDFQTFLEYGWSYLSTSVNNEKVCYPKLAVSDFSFANIHAILAVFNQTKIKEYIEVLYKCSLKNEDIPFGTILTICENHLLPSFLLFARNLHSDKLVADTLVAGLLKVLEADSLATALKVFENLAIIHCSKEISEEARKNIKELVLNNDDTPPGDIIGDFGDDAPEEDDVRFGNRKGLRENSPYYKVFKKILDKVLENNRTTQTSNRFFAPKLMLAMTKQYLSLFPLFSASSLPDKKLTTNSYIELYWKDQRRILHNIPDRLRWPPRYLGELHSKIRREAKAMLTHGLVPNLKHGGKIKPGQTKQFETYMDSKSRTSSRKNTFIPAASKPKKPKLDVNESYGGSFERWDSQKSKVKGRKRENYIKGKDVDHAAIIESMDVPFEKFRITGSRKFLHDPTQKAPMPDEVELRQETINWLLSKNLYVSTEVVDAGLMLLDKRLNEESFMSESVFVYNVQILRVILNGESNLVNNGKFITILPRDFGLSSETDRYAAFKAGRGEDSVPGSHYTLVSNLQCGPGEVDIYETFEPFRSPDSLLTENGKKILKILAKSQNLTVNCKNVQLQEESECGALAVALAVQLCFHAADEGAVHNKMKNVRRELFRCLKENKIDYFQCSKVKLRDNEKTVFSVNVQ